MKLTELNTLAGGLADARRTAHTAAVEVENITLAYREGHASWNAVKEARKHLLVQLEYVRSLASLFPDTSK
jgi:hypothetical protein